jgi:hydroxymethylbilane synthase
MAVLRLGTRGSELALTQSRWFCAQLVAAHADIEIQEVIIKTHGDLSVDQPFSPDMPVGIFVSALEQALTQERIDFAVHSFKDLQTAETEGLIVAAIPEREVVHDVLLTREPVELDRLSPGFRVGTSSPRRSAQFRRLGNVEIVPIRGNVPTRVGKLESGDLDGVILAAAGLKRLGISHPHVTPLPTDRFVPSPAQGALAIQVRESSPAEKAIRTMDHAPSRRAVEAERSFLKTINAGCHTPVGALASIDENSISLRGQLFSDDGNRMVEGTASGDDPLAVGRQLAEQLMNELGAPS